MKVRSHDISPSAARGIAALCAAVFVISAHPARAGFNVWTSQGPGAPTFQTVVLDPTAPNTLYAAGTSLYLDLGAFKSTNAGSSWSAANTGLPELSVSAPLAVDPNVPDTLYAGTLRNGVFKSTDGGGTWSPANTGLPGTAAIFVLAVDPNTPGTLYAGTYDLDTNANGVFKSTNAGGTWSVANTGLPDTGTSASEVNALAVDRTTPGTLYAAMGLDNVSGGVFKSTDGGSSWSATTNADLPGTFGIYVAALAIDPTAPDTLYAGTVGGGLFKSTNAGGTWSASGCLGPPDTCTAGLPVLTFAALLTLAVDPTTPGRLYAGGNGVAKSTDFGATWSDGSAGLPGQAIVNSLAVDRTTPGRLYTAGYGGAYKSTDGASSWNATANAGLPGTAMISTLAIDPITPGTLYAGAYKSTDAGATWGAANTDLANSGVDALAIDATASGTLYAAIKGGVLKTTNAGSTWGAAITGLSGYVNALTIDPTTPATLYARTYYDVFKSTDGGGTWSPANTGLPESIPLYTSRVSALGLDPTTHGTLYAGTIATDCRPPGSELEQVTSKGGPGLQCFTTTVEVFKSTNAGNAWSKAGKGLSTNVAVNGFAFDPTAPDTLYAETEDDHVFKSTDGGGRWNAVNFPGLPVFDPTTLSILYAWTNGAFASTDVFKSTDAGATWNPFITGMGANVAAFAVDPTRPGRLYAATAGRGVFDIEQVAATVVCGTKQATITKPKLTIRKLNTPTGDDTLSFQGTLTLPTPVNPALNPLANGVRVLIEDTAGTALDVTIPRGTGWTANGSGTKWTYRNNSATPPGGIDKMVIQDKSAVTPGLVKFTVNGKAGSYAVAAADLPVTARIFLDALSGAQCGGVLPRCAFNGSGGTLKCK
jgi:photosystem II stability/assembly factor-like uncharacterized protein